MESKRKYAQSVRQKLLNFANENNDDFQMILTRYGLERLIARISQSKYKNSFILKGAMLFQIWSETNHRATRDVDFLSFGSNDVVKIKETFISICKIEIPEDGIIFEIKNIFAGKIKADQKYEGVRIHIPALLERTRITIRIDVGFGDAIVPEAREHELSTLLDFPSPVIRTYSQETVIAEKFQALVDLGFTNSRLKDFYDLYFLITNFEYDEEILTKAIETTFENRQTKIPNQIPIGLTEEFSKDKDKMLQWKSFLKKTNVSVEISLEEIVKILRNFFTDLLPQLNKEN
ncbi:MAG: nucleotidyl transferase AbiEii/AbiGii toxin family protein [Aridibacter sp.]